MKTLAVVLLGFVVSWLTPTVVAADPRVDDAVARGLDFLRESQNADGSWSPQPGPAITALALTAFLDEPGVGLRDEHAQRALAFILAKVQPDGSIRSAPDAPLANYNTAISLSALSRIPDEPGVAPVIAKAQRFLTGLQWQTGMTDAQGQAIKPDHPFYGGAGYGKHGRPDLSNTQFMLQALHDSGLPRDDPAWERALVFISRLQGVPSNTYFEPGTLENRGGFIYATSVNRDLPGVPQSMANPDQIDEARAGRPVSGLRGYGSVTYAGFKSYLYADLAPDDPRVTAALGWIAENYTLDANPGMPEPAQLQGLFYYYLTHARALNAFGEDTLETADGPVDWRGNLISALLERQQDDGSWINTASRWMEDNQNLVTAYSLLALQNARR